MTTVFGPVTDWATDFDHGDPEYNANIHKIWEELKSAGCPIAHSDRYGGVWLPLTHEMVHEIAYDTEHFTSRSVVVSVGRPGDLSLPAPIGGAPPITSDPPFHAIARRLLLPAFAPKVIEPWEPKVRELCVSLLDRLGPLTEGESIIDAAQQYAQHIPVSVIRQMLGFPEQDEELFRRFVHDVLERIAEEPGTRDGMEELGHYIYDQIQDHRANPRDDLTSYLMGVKIDGIEMTDEIVGGMIILLLIAGIDTTWSAIGSSLWHLAQHPEDHQRLLDDPDVMTFALEEFLRLYPNVLPANAFDELLRIGKRKEARKIALEALEIHPGEPLAIIVLAFLDLRAENVPGAIEWLKKGLQPADPQRPMRFGVVRSQCQRGLVTGFRFTVPSKTT